MIASRSRMNAASPGAQRRTSPLTRSHPGEKPGRGPRRCAAAAVDRMFDRVLSEYGQLDIMVNNAGIQIAEDSHELSAADFDKVLAVNLRGAFLCARQAVRSYAL
jgi:NAD(P)-dependent dehydrogenase (short-subunit alcohol dehydrogenase family)